MFGKFGFRDRSHLLVRIFADYEENKMSYIENNPTYRKHTREKGKVQIVRIAPFLDGVEIEYRTQEDKKPFIKIIVTEMNTNKIAYEKVQCYAPGHLRVKGLAPEIDYLAEVIVCDENLEERARSNARIFRCGFFPGTVIDYIHPDDMTFIESGRYVGSPHIIKTPSGTMVASHDVFGYGGVHSSLCRFFGSNDSGKTWFFKSEIKHCTWGTMFVNNNTLYIIGTSQGSKGGDLLLYYSNDEAGTWSDPIVLAKHGEQLFYRSTPTAYAIHNDRIWFYLGVHENGTNKVAAASVELCSDIANPANWTISEATEYNNGWKDVAESWHDMMIEEGNMVVDQNGEIKMLVRCNSHRYGTVNIKPENIRALLFKIDQKDPLKAPEFDKAILFNGGLHKFYIQYDEVQKKYLALVNRMTVQHLSQRNVLSLFSSEDLDKWILERDLINLEDLNWPEGQKAAVQYPSFIVENNEIAAVVRTALNGADSFHDSNAITFHRFREIKDNYRFW